MFGNMRKNLEKGQALSEYVATYPVGIMVGILLAGGLSLWLGGAYTEIVDAVDQKQVVVCEPVTSETVEGPTSVAMGSHDITMTSNVYDPETNTTTVSYTVHSGGDPSISHWVLGIGNDVTIANMADIASEKPGWVVNDPSAPDGNGISGLKFDSGYESSGGEGSGGGNSGGGNPGGGNSGGGSGKGKKQSVMIIQLRDALMLSGAYSELITDTRTISLVLSGQYDFQEGQVAIKAGNEYYTATIAAPVLKTTTSTTTTTYAEGC